MILLRFSVRGVSRVLVNNNIIRAWQFLVICFFFFLLNLSKFHVSRLRNAILHKMHSLYWNIVRFTNNISWIIFFDNNYKKTRPKSIKRQFNGACFPGLPIKTTKLRTAVKKGGKKTIKTTKNEKNIWTLFCSRAGRNAKNKNVIKLILIKNIKKMSDHYRNLFFFHLRPSNKMHN